MKPSLKPSMLKQGKVLYILNASVKELLMQHHNFFMQRSRELLDANNIPVYTLKADALTIYAVEAVNFEPGTGKWRVNKTEESKFPHELLAMMENKHIPIGAKQHHLTPPTVQEEYDVDKICDYFEQHKRVMVRAKFAGRGKSYACTHMQSKDHKMSFICPTNRLSANYGVSGVTLNKFLGIGVSEDSKMARLDDSSYDTIVFDEIFFASRRKLARIILRREN